MKDITGQTGRWVLFVSWAYTNSATGDWRGAAKPRPASEQDELDQIRARMRNQECESKSMQKFLETHKQEMNNVREETKDVKEKVEEFGDTINGMTVEFSQMEQ